MTIADDGRADLKESEGDRGGKAIRQELYQEQRYLGRGGTVYIKKASHDSETTRRHTFHLKSTNNTAITTSDTVGDFLGFEFRLTSKF